MKETLAETRAKYWIPSGRSLTRKIIHKCVICRKFEGLPFKAPQLPPLPECRVKETPAFSYIYWSRPSDDPYISVFSIYWMTLFTCYVTRAVHLDTVLDQSTLAFTRCLKRFVARRGLPRRFISDNGKTFKAASKYLDTMISTRTLHRTWS